MLRMYVSMIQGSSAGCFPRGVAQAAWMHLALWPFPLQKYGTTSASHGPRMFEVARGYVLLNRLNMNGAHACIRGISMPCCRHLHEQVVEITRDGLVVDHKLPRSAADLGRAMGGGRCAASRWMCGGHKHACKSSEQGLPPDV